MKNLDKLVIKSVTEESNNSLQNYQKKWLRTQELANYLGLSKSQINVLKNNGTLPYTKLGGSIYYSIQDVDAILSSNKIGELK